MRSDWPGPPKSTSWWATRPASRTEWTWIPSAVTPPRAPAQETVVVGSSPSGPAPEAARAAPIRRAGLERGARGGVLLLVVVELDHLDAVEERRRQLGEAHHQHRRERVVGGDDRVRPARRVEGGPQPVESRGVDPRRPADRVDLV